MNEKTTQILEKMIASQGKTKKEIEIYLKFLDFFEQKEIITDLRDTMPSPQELKGLAHDE